MGVPAFFRWLSVRYPKIVLNALTEDELEYMYDEFKSQADDPNEINLMDGDLDGTIQQKIKDNNPEFDNLYLDMNGIIHPCAHPQDKAQPKNESEMFNNIFEYTDKVMKIVKPQRLVYMAVDGVAPRAKQNQQRSRRFRSALDTEERQTREADIRNKWSKEGVKFSDNVNSDTQKFDQNVITPGTEFMWRLSKALQYYVMERLQNHKDWKGVKVIFSDASIPGEGEHKILDFIRSQRTQPGYDHNTRHCIYGADADLIMLGLSTHEPHFCILREAFLAEFDKKCIICGTQGHLAAECPQNKDSKQEKVRLSKSVQFQFIKLNVVREYLELEFKDLQLPFAFDFERIIDDFVFLCFFVGNDFLPHLPSLQIREGALDALIVIYKNQLPTLGDYLTKNGEIDFSKVDLIFNDIAKIEEEIFQQKKQNDERQARFAQQKGQNSNNSRGGGSRQYQKEPKSEHIKFDQPSNIKETQVERGGSTPSEDAKSEIEQEISGTSTIQEIEDITLREIQRKQNEITDDELNRIASERMKDIVKKMLADKEKKIAESYVDRVRLGTEGWKLRYYRNKFHVPQQDLDEFTQKIKKAYIEGLQWVYSYYYKGCVSWYWFYPFHYAPFASDLVNCDQIQLKQGLFQLTALLRFDIGEPASPFEQLLGVFPKQSAHAIPLCYRPLLSDPNSEIIDFYPTYMRLDINGARFAWMGVNLLPFLDRQRLIRAMKNCEKGLTEHEKERNKLGQVYVFFEKKDKSSSGVMQILNQGLTQCDKIFASFQTYDEIGGTIRIHKSSVKIGEKVKMPLTNLDLESIDSNQVYQVVYEHPKYDRHITKLLKDTTLPKREVDEYEIYHTNRRFFNGENAVRMLERCLGIRSSLYNPQGYTNNHATYEQPSQQLGKRRYEDNQYPVAENDGYKRQRRNNGYNNNNQGYNNNNQGSNYQHNYNNQYQNQQYQQNYYQQQQPPQQQYNYNLQQYNQPSYSYQQQQQQQQYPPQQEYKQYNQQQQAQDPVLMQPKDHKNILMNLLTQIGAINNQNRGGNGNNQQQQNQQQQKGNGGNNNRFQGFQDKQ